MDIPGSCLHFVLWDALQGQIPLECTAIFQSWGDQCMSNHLFYRVSSPGWGNWCRKWTCSKIFLVTAATYSPSRHCKGISKCIPVLNGEVLLHPRSTMKTTLIGGGGGIQPLSLIRTEPKSVLLHPEPNKHWGRKQTTATQCLPLPTTAAGSRRISWSKILKATKKSWSPKVDTPPSSWLWYSSSTSTTNAVSILQVYPRYICWIYKYSICRYYKPLNSYYFYHKLD